MAVCGREGVAKFLGVARPVASVLWCPVYRVRRYGVGDARHLVGSRFARPQGRCDLILRGDASSRCGLSSTETDADARRVPLRAERVAGIVPLWIVPVLGAGHLGGVEGQGLEEHLVLASRQRRAQIVLD